MVLANFVLVYGVVAVGGAGEAGETPPSACNCEFLSGWWKVQQTLVCPQL